MRMKITFLLLFSNQIFLRARDFFNCLGGWESQKLKEIWKFVQTSTAIHFDKWFLDSARKPQMRDGHGGPFPGTRTIGPWRKTKGCPQNHGVFQLGTNVIHTGAIIYDTNPNNALLWGNPSKLPYQLSIPPYFNYSNDPFSYRKVNWNENLVGLPSWWAPYFQCLSLSALGALATPSVVAFLAFTHGPFATNLVSRWFFEFFETKKYNNPTGKKNDTYTTYNYTPLFETPKKK